MILGIFAGRTPSQLQLRIEKHKAEKTKLKDIINQAAADRAAAINEMQQELTSLYVIRDSF